MSRRYGRNQKQRHREEIARWKQAYENESRLFRTAKSDLAAADKTIREMIAAIERVCRHSVVLPPKTIAGMESRDHLRLGVLSPLEVTRCISPNDTWFDIVTHTVDLHALHVCMRDCWETFGLAVHVEYGTVEKVAYMISPEALSRMPPKELEEHIARELARCLAERAMEVGSPTIS